MTEQKVDVFVILQLWRKALETGLCVKEFHIEKDGKTFDFDLKEPSEYNCDDCKSEFCFKSLEWLHDCGDSGGSKLNQDTPPKQLEYERAYT